MSRRPVSAIHRHILNIERVNILLSSQLNTLENELKSSPTDTTSQWDGFLYFPLSPLHLWLPVDSSHEVVPGLVIVLQCGKGHPARHVLALSGCRLQDLQLYSFTCYSLLVPIWRDRLKAANGRKREEDLITRCPLPNTQQHWNPGCYQQHSLTNNSIYISTLKQTLF